MKMKNLKYTMLGDEPSGHPQEVMSDLGIKYINARPESLGSCWFFFGCSNVPEPLPKFLEEVPSHTINELAKPLDLNRPPRREIQLDASDRLFINDTELTDFDRIDELIDIVENSNDDDDWSGDGGEADGGGASGSWGDDD